jgi:putative ABC transport system ATP-binding protein
MHLIRLESVRKSYSLHANTIHAVNDINLSVGEGEFVAFSGPSGSGKSTLFSLIAGMTPPSAGRVLIDGTDISGFSNSEGALLRRRLFGFVFQSFNLMPVLSALENIELPLLMTALNKSERMRRVHEVAERLEITALLDHRPNEMSGGQKQRVAVARALVTHPRIIVADEPTANLDLRTGQLVLEIARERCHSQNVAFLFSSHDPSMVAQADRVVQMRDGAVVSAGEAPLRQFVSGATV